MFCKVLVSIFVTLDIANNCLVGNIESLQILFGFDKDCQPKLKKELNLFEDMVCIKSFSYHNGL